MQEEKEKVARERQAEEKLKKETEEIRKKQRENTSARIEDKFSKPEIKLDK